MAVPRILPICLVTLGVLSAPVHAESISSIYEKFNFDKCKLVEEGDRYVIRRCRMEGFIVIDFLDRIGEAMVDMGRWVAEGRIVAETDVQQGMENVPRTFLRLFAGKNRGKQLCQIGDAP